MDNRDVNHIAVSSPWTVYNDTMSVLYTVCCIYNSLKIS